MWSRSGSGGINEGQTAPTAPATTTTTTGTTSTITTPNSTEDHSNTVARHYDGGNSTATTTTIPPPIPVKTASMESINSCTGPLPPQQFGFGRTPNWQSPRQISSMVDQLIKTRVPFLSGK